jgi:nitrogen fixation NifU-like protein
MTSPGFNFDELDYLYREVILDHYRSPRNQKSLPNADVKAEGFNPFCGDEITVALALDGDGRIQDVSFKGRGCSISQASASMMSEALKGKTLEEAEAISAQFRTMMQGKELPESQKAELEELEALQGVCKFPVRIKCALLGWATLVEGIQAYRAKRGAAHGQP